MENAAALQILLALWGEVLTVWLRCRYASDLWKRLEETRTHKEIRQLKGQLPPVTFRERFTKGAHWPERERLSSDELPPVLTAVRRVVPYLDWCSLLAAGMVWRTGGMLWRYAGWVCLVLMGLLAAVYLIAEHHHTAAHLPKMHARAEKQRIRARHDHHPVHVRKYTPREMRVVITANAVWYGSLYALMLLCILSEDVTYLRPFAAGGFLVHGLFMEYSYRHETELFLCIAQTVCHKRMTPYEHSDQFRRYAKKEMKGAGLIEIVLGALVLACLLLFPN